LFDKQPEKANLCVGTTFLSFAACHISNYLHELPCLIQLRFNHVKSFGMYKILLALILLNAFPFFSFSQKDDPKIEDVNAPELQATSTTAGQQSIYNISLSEVAANVGKTVTVCGKVYDARLLKNVIGQPTLMNLGGDFANERVELRIRFEKLANFDYNPSKLFLHKNICITGTITNNFGFAEIAIDTMNARRLIREAIADHQDSTDGKNKKLRLIGPAYLFAGPSLNEPIITHLKVGSIIIPEYSEGGWSYVRIIQKSGTGEHPDWLYGFVRNQALGMNRKGQVTKEEKKTLSFPID
jgi:hypothetical protein